MIVILTALAVCDLYIESKGNSKYPKHVHFLLSYSSAFRRYRFHESVYWIHNLYLYPFHVVNKDITFLCVYIIYLTQHV